eukprot:364728-Chlamydomonas_euryale.AAC.7
MGYKHGVWRPWQHACYLALISRAPLCSRACCASPPHTQKKITQSITHHAYTILWFSVPSLCGAQPSSGKTATGLVIQPDRSKRSARVCNDLADRAALLRASAGDRPAPGQDIRGQAGCGCHPARGGVREGRGCRRR